MAGIEAAEADVLTFLDSHIEATDGWLEPLLDRVARNYRTVACPVIEATQMDSSMRERTPFMMMMSF